MPRIGSFKEQRGPRGGEVIHVVERGLLLSNFKRGSPNSFIYSFALENRLTQIIATTFRQCLSVELLIDKEQLQAGSVGVGYAQRPHIGHTTRCVVGVMASLVMVTNK
jgi:hypothetical protein